MVPNFTKNFTANSIWFHSKKSFASYFWQQLTNQKAFEVDMSSVQSDCWFSWMSNKQEWNFYAKFWNLELPKSLERTQFLGTELENCLETKFENIRTETPDFQFQVFKSLPMSKTNTPARHWKKSHSRPKPINYATFLGFCGFLGTFLFEKLQTSPFKTYACQVAISCR